MMGRRELILVRAQHAVPLRFGEGVPLSRFQWEEDGWLR